MLLLAGLDRGPGSVELFLPQELTFLGRVVAQADLLLLPLTVDVARDVVSVLWVFLV